MSPLAIGGSDYKEKLERIRQELVAEAIHKLSFVEQAIFWSSSIVHDTRGIVRGPSYLEFFAELLTCAKR